MSPFMNLLYQDLSPNTLESKATEEEHPALFKKKESIRNLCLNLEPSKKERFQLHSLEGTMIEEIYPSELTIKTLYLS